MVPFEVGLDIFSELEKILSVKVEPVLLPPIAEELGRLISKGKPKVRRIASSALRLAEKCVKLEYERRAGETVDDYLVRIAKETRLPVATADLELKRKLRAEGIATIYVRGGRRLAFEGGWA
jgi:rRNA-processing protein FCF1